MLTKFISLLRKSGYPQPYEMRFADGAVFRNLEGPPLFRVEFKNNAAISETLVHGSMGFAEAYMRGDIDIEGDLQHVAHLGFLFLENAKPSLAEKIRIFLRYLANRNTLDGSRRNIRAHYDLGNDFYSLWLDREMQYTCAYFADESDSLEKAQLRKLDVVCRKLDLRPGELVVEAGCGWGGFARYAAANYGVRVKAFNISEEQIKYAKEKLKPSGISENQVEYIRDDYRNIPAHIQECDKFVSVGMLEHVGLVNYPVFYSLINRVLRPDGLALVHSIGRIRPSPTDPWLAKHIFPGAYMPSLSEILEPAEKLSKSELHPCDVENMRYHYALTLDAWSARFERNAGAIREKYGEAFVRKFRFYLRGSAAAFRFGGLMLYQVLFAHNYQDILLNRPQFYRDRIEAERSAVPS